VDFERFCFTVLGFCLSISGTMLISSTHRRNAVCSQMFPGDERKSRRHLNTASPSHFSDVFSDSNRDRLRLDSGSRSRRINQVIIYMNGVCSNAVHDSPLGNPCCYENLLKGPPCRLFRVISSRILGGGFFDVSLESCRKRGDSYSCISLRRVCSERVYRASDLHHGVCGSKVYCQDIIAVGIFIQSFLASCS
jgi:hypothetical protein